MGRRLLTSLSSTALSWRKATRNISQGALLQYRALVLGDGTVLDAAPAGLDASNVTRYVAIAPSGIRSAAYWPHPGVRAYPFSMYTWVVGFDAINASSPVPAMMWFTTDPERARWDYPEPGSIAFDSGDAKLRFYSSVEVHREGSGRKDGNVRRSSQEVRARPDAAHSAALTDPPARRSRPRTGPSASSGSPSLRTSTSTGPAATATR